MGRGTFRFFLFIVLSTSVLNASQAGVFENYLNGCRRAVYRLNAKWERRIATDPSRAFWVTDSNDLEAVTAALNSAFEEDPIFLWMSPDAEVRKKLFRTLVRHAFFNGGILSTQPVGRGAALWFDTAKAPMGVLTTFLTGQFMLAPKFFNTHTLEILKLDAFLEGTRKRLLKEAGASQGAIYLFLVGVAPDMQGKGLGGDLIKPVLRYADQQGKAIILETHKTANLPLYEHLGFHVANQETVPESAPMTTTMLRLPQEP